MDIRISSYSAGTVPGGFGGTTVTASSGTPLGRATVQNAASSSPVQAVSAVGSARANLIAQALNQVASGGDSGGYTDSVRGSLVNILA